ncbi:MAG: polyribonucleotide nucleotidyltransferase [Candidatus Sungbacteria bacterium]|nr:polyribonucleotide nucleotidyltransferase [Candidatus Sungbacteria bacterium]
MDSKKFTTRLGSEDLSVELTELAGQANGHVLVRLGDTSVLVTAVMSKNTREGGDYFPLMVDYEEKFYAAGKILGSRFVKRESRPSEEAILSARLIDRTIRPRFNPAMRNEVQVVATVLSLDDKNDPDIPALLGASLALSLSDIPWDGPVAGVRIGRDENGWIVNPTFAERAASALDLVVSGTDKKINMLEAGAKEVPEKEIAVALELAHEEIKKLAAFEEKIIASNPPRKTAVPLMAVSGPLYDQLVQNFSAKMAEVMWEKEKSTRAEKLARLKEDWEKLARDEFPETAPAGVEHLWEHELSRIVPLKIVERGVRPDGRKAGELRPIRAFAGAIPRVHGSGLFIRGETQALSTLTLGSPGDELIIEGMEVRTKRHFMHHYNFPPYSTGEIKPLRGPGRREIGHGALAERSLLAMIPPREEFPYTIRIVSEILSSNGSSSMASVCGSTLALFDAGVPMKKAVAGIAMGLMMRDDAHYMILTDVQGPEDHYGDMDFKAAGTQDGITGLQMDVKVDGVTVKMLEETLEQARAARLAILEKMLAVIPKPRENLSPFAPRIVTLKIDPEKIGALIGPGGKMINSITASTGVEIDIEDDGTVFITSEKEQGMEEALALIKQITREYKPGELMEGKVSRIFDFGAMVEVGPKQEGLIHISELAPWHVARVEDVVNVGDKIPVMVKNIDDQGRLNLSLKNVPGRYSDEDIAKAEAINSSSPRGGFGRPSGRYDSFSRGRNERGGRERSGPNRRGRF